MTTKTRDSPLQHEWMKRSPALDDKEMLEDTKIRVKEVHRLKVSSLRRIFPKESKEKENLLINQRIYRFVEPDELILSDIIRHERTPSKTTAFIRGGPRETLFFKPDEVVAGIVTCGGICPGLNNVIRELVRSLKLMYGVKQVWGFIGGYAGIYSTKPVELTVENVDDIHHIGGSILQSNRGGFDEAKIYNHLKSMNITQFYVIGGDGTMRGANKLSKYFIKKAKEDSSFICTVAAVPKTIDNDVDIIDQSFGFSTAVTEALRAIASAKSEALSVPNGIGIVKLMGRHAGFIAIHACLAFGEVDLCLIPESDLILDGPNGILPHLNEVLEKKGNAVVVVAEGAGEDILGQHEGVDAGGNRILPQIGEFLKGRISQYFESKNVAATVKYIDPSYMIRSVKANASDAIMCLILASNCVHAAMAGLTGFCVGICNNRTCYLPMEAIVQNSPRKVDIHGRTYDRMLSITGQPRFDSSKASL